MSQFQLYLELGFNHILDINATDHILFIIVMICIYKLKDWKTILGIITSFTVGHTLTLIISVFDIVSTKPQLIELAIALTILFTALENIFWQKAKEKRLIFSGIFGLIHGLGFSNYLKSLLGKQDSIVTPLFAFNIGIEVGQILLVLILFTVMYLIFKFTKLSQKSTIVFISILVAIQSVIWVIDRF